MKAALHPTKWFVRFITVVLLLSVLLVPASVPAFMASGAQSVIVQGQSADQVSSIVAEYGGKVTSRLEIINGVAALVPADHLTALRADKGILQVTSNAATQLSGTEFTESDQQPNEIVTDYPDVTGTNLVWQAGVTGQNVTVAIVDTGIAYTATVDKGADGKERKLLAWVDYIDGKKQAFDPNGHGTHIAGIIASSDIGADGEYNGVAPGVDLVGVRVLDETGAGTYESVINGIQWVVQHKDEYNIRVLNLSLHALVQSPYWADPLNQAVMRAWQAGITVVVASGNDGPAPMTVSVPGNVPYVITVGAFTDNYTPDNWTDDYVTPFSSAGPTLDNFVKPDLVAPGGHIVSKMLPSSYISKNHEANRLSGQYFSMAGTSQAAAVTSGVAALMISKDPSLTPDQLKYRLMFTALPWVNEDGTDALYSIWQQGTGRLNAYDAVMSNLIGEANQGLNITADVNGTQHFEGFSYFDDTTGEFRLHGEFGEILNNKLGAWSGKLGAWSGSYYGSWAEDLGAWSGKLGAWSGKLGAWSGGLGAWSGKLGAWSGGLGAWSGKLGAWSGGSGTWEGGYTAYIDKLGAWSGKLGAWSGKLGAWSGSITEPVYIENFKEGNAPSYSSPTSLSIWVEEPTQ